jgi:hypothetical protein
MESQLRVSPRYAFYASAELTGSPSDTPTTAHTSNLGSNGCFLDTSDPLPEGTIVNIQITYQGQVFAARSVVAHSHPETGMGLKFIALESGCASILEAWLDEAALA